MTTDPGRRPGESFADYRQRLIDTPVTTSPAPRWWFHVPTELCPGPHTAVPIVDGAHVITTLPERPTRRLPDV